MSSNAEQTQSRTPAIVGFLFAGAAVLGLGFLGSVRAGADDVRDVVPAIRILQPGDGVTLRNPVVIRFATDASLRLERHGWAAGDLHLHALADGTEYMPAAADITVHDSYFEWRLPHLAAGQRSLHLTWAGRHHGNLATPGDTLRITIVE